MEKRHIIMIIIVALFALIMFSLKDAKNTKTLTCTVNGEMEGLESLTTLTVNVNNNEVRDMSVLIDVKIPEEYESNKQALINQISASGKMQVSSTKDGIRLKAGMNSSYFNALGLDRNTSYNELKQVLELDGYTCK